MVADNGEACDPRPTWKLFHAGWLERPTLGKIGPKLEGTYAKWLLEFGTLAALDRLDEIDEPERDPWEVFPCTFAKPTLCSAPR